MGDSHILAVAYAALDSMLRADISLCVVSGATAQGLHNPNSRTNALPIFEQRCARARSWQKLLFMLGEVDCGFVIWYRAKKYNVDIESQLRLSLNAYSNLLAQQVDDGFSVLVLSAPLPTIRDGQNWGEVANARREVDASQRDRTDLTLEYNARLSEICSEIGASFIDATSQTLDPQTRLLRPEYLNSTPTDHHLDRQRYVPLVGSAISTALVDLP